MSYYSHFLRNVLEPAVRQHRPGTAPERILFQHDNAPSHSAGETVRTIREIGWTNLSHPAYSPDLAPSDYHLFANLKKIRSLTTVHITLGTGINCVPVVPDTENDLAS